MDIKNKDDKSIYILLLNQNGVYSPYGKSYICNKKWLLLKGFLNIIIK